MRNTLLRTERLRRNWTQQQLADFAGISLSTVERAERGGSIRVDCIQQLCACLSKTSEELGLLKIEYSAAQSESSETSEHITVTGLNTLHMLTEDHLAAFASLLKLGEAIMFDPTKRKTLETLLATLSMAMIKPQGLLQSEALKHILEPETDLAGVNEATIQGYAKLIEACWQLSKGNELALAEKLLPECMTKLVPLAQQPSQYQHSAANLTAQGFRLYGILALHRNDLQARELYCKQAVQYSKLAGDQNLLIASLKGLADTYYYGDQYLQSLQTYLDALQYAKGASPLLHARVYMGLAVAYAYIDRKQDALSYLGLSLDTFPDHPETDPCFSFADFDLSQMILWDGITHSKLGHTKQALDTFSRTEQSGFTATERVRIEIINQRAKTAILAGDLEQGSSYTETGLTGAKTLRSQRRLNEAYDNYRQMAILWPYEKRVKTLGELLHSQQ